jgi:hypothetical protein
MDGRLGINTVNATKSSFFIIRLPDWYPFHAVRPSGIKISAGNIVSRSDVANKTQPRVGGACLRQSAGFILASGGPLEYHNHSAISVSRSLLSPIDGRQR